MKKELKEYLEIVNPVSAKDSNWIAESLENYAEVQEKLTTDEVEYQIWEMIQDKIEDEDLVFDNSETKEAKALIESIISDLGGYQEKSEREYEEEREAVNRAFRHAKGFN